MAFNVGDFTVDQYFRNAADQAVYTDITSRTFSGGTVYLLCIVGDDLANLDANTALGVPTTPGITWTLVDTVQRVYASTRVYVTAPGSDVTDATTSTFPGPQAGCSALLLAHTNAHGTPVQSNTKRWN